MVTLTTCHPYPNNYQRYVVYCERTTDETDSLAEFKSEESTGAYTTQNETQITSKEVKTNSSKFFITFEKIIYTAVPLILIALTIVLIKRK